MSKIHSKIVTVTPAIAEKWLKRNPGNRRLRPRQVDKYVSDMLAGRWTVNNDDICFDPDGNLLNGQHRLTAVHESGVTVEMGVKYNVPREYMGNMDNGAARSAADGLSLLDGTKSPGLTASAARFLAMHESGRLYGDALKQNVSHAEIREFVKTSALLERSVETISSVKRSIECSPTALTAAHYLISEHCGPDVADYFFQQLATRTNQPAGSAILVLDSKFRDLKRNKTALPMRELVELTLIAFNKYATNTHTQRLVPSQRAGAPWKLPPVQSWQRGPVPPQIP